MTGEPAPDTVLPRAHSASVLSAVIRSVPDDFQVEEMDAFSASGSGEHLLLQVEKRGMNTAFAANTIARWAGVAESAVGYAGLKDRHAVTRQRFSVWLPKKNAPDIATLQRTDLRVLQAQWHARKLPRGALAGNRFVLTLRQVEGEVATIDRRLQMIATYGVPNYFGEQRSGRNGDNLPQALAMFAGRRVRRDERTVLLSAARSQLFNQMLAARIRVRAWDQALPGEVWILDGSRSVFGPEPMTELLQQRLEEFDIHPSAALWGRGPLRSQDALQALELEAVGDARALRLRTGLEKAGLKPERRATRVRPQAFHWQWLDQGVLRLEFSLPPGSYATAVLDELGEHRSHVSAAAGTMQASPSGEPIQAGNDSGTALPPA